MSEPLSRSTRLWYGFGQLAEGVKNDTYGIFLLFYYTSVVGLSGTLAGQAILIALLFDAVTDPLVGAASDRLESRWGRRHPFLFAAAIPLPVFFYLSFAPPPDLTQLELFGWLTVTTVLTRGSMTLFHVPHLALGAELSDDFEMRSNLVTLQNLFARFGGVLAGGLGFIVFLRPTAVFPDGRFNVDAYPPFALCGAAIMCVTILLSAWNTRSRIPYLTKPDAETIAEHALGGLVRGLRQAMSMSSFRSLFFGTLIMFVAWGVTTTLGLHLATYFWQVSTIDLLYWGVGAGAGVFGGLPFWLRRANATDKKSVFMQGGALFMIATVFPPFLRLAGYWPQVGNPIYVPLWVVTTGLIAHWGIAALMVTGRSMMADVTDEFEVDTGRRGEGIFFGASSFAAKAFFGIGSQIAGIVFDVVGLEKGMTVESAPITIVRDLGLTLGLSVLLLVGLSLVVFGRYNLTRARCNELRAILDARRRDAEPPGSEPTGRPEPIV